MAIANGRTNLLEATHFFVHDVHRLQHRFGKSADGGVSGVFLADAAAGTALEQAADFVRQQPTSAQAPTDPRGSGRSASAQAATEQSTVTPQGIQEASILDAAEQELLGAPELA